MGVGVVFHTYEVEDQSMSGSVCGRSFPVLCYFQLCPSNLQRYLQAIRSSIS